MKEIKTEILINAPIEKIWTTLLDFQSYPTWNSFLRKIEGKPQVGSQLSVTIEPPLKKPMLFKPKVLAASPYEFKWQGNLLLPGIFDGTHRFALERVTDNKTKFIHSEIFTGIFHGPIFNLIANVTQAGFENMNMNLKNYCEG